MGFWKKYFIFHRNVNSQGMLKPNKSSALQSTAHFNNLNLPELLRGWN